MLRSARLGLSVVAALATAAALFFNSQENTLAFLVSGIVAVWSACGASLAANRRMGVAATAAIAAIIGSYLGIEHVVKAADPICSVNETFNCSLVNQSEYAELFGVPLGFLGAAFYAGVALVALLAAPGKPRFAKAPHLVLLGGALSVLYSVFLAWASTQVGAWCLFCISLYGLNLLLLVGGLSWTRETGIPVASGIKDVFFAKEETSLTALAAVMVLGVILGRGYANKHAGEGAEASGGEAPTPVEQLSVYTTPGAVALDGTEPLMGNPSAKITVVEFADFQCPFCGVVAPDLHELASAVPDLRVIFKQYPLDNTCNPNIKRKFHEYSCKAAVATECARQQGRFWELNRLFFMNQEAIDDEAIPFMAKQIGLDMSAFETCRQGAEALQSVQADIQAATAMQVSGTPSLFVHGLYGDQWVRVRTPGDIGQLVMLAAEGKALPSPVAPPPDE